MSSIIFFGECMVEIRPNGPDALHQSFAGDVYNSAVYLKRCYPLIDTAFCSAIGNDVLSKQLISQIDAENIDSQFIFTHSEKSPGIYLIETDDSGERSFTYWRSDSAARKVMEFIGDSHISQMGKSDIFFFSGISLAVLAPWSRDNFWRMVSSLKAQGVKIAFDPNYRARLWESKEQAKQQFDLAFEHSHIVLPGIEDFASLYDLHNADDVLAYCKKYNIDETVIKNGPESVITCLNGDIETHSIKPVSQVVDTTSAGDSFNGGYLGSRLSGNSVSKSVVVGANAAACVIQHRGAIINKHVFEDAMKSTLPHQHQTTGGEHA